MESLFRLLLARPAVVQDEQTPSIRLAQTSQFQTELGQAQQATERRDALKRIARTLSLASIHRRSKDFAIHD